MRAIHAIPTEYAGVRFRSRLEAKWAAFFDLVSWPWEYEPLDLYGYVPDFILRLYKPIVVEVKPLMWVGTPQEEEIRADALRKLRHSGWDGESLLLGACTLAEYDGRPKLGEIEEVVAHHVKFDPWDGSSRTDEYRAWGSAFTFTCDDCGQRSFAHAEWSWRCRVNGCYSGNQTAESMPWDPARDFRAASNKVQWNAA